MLNEKLKKFVQELDNGELARFYGQTSLEQAREEMLYRIKNLFEILMENSTNSPRLGAFKLPDAYKTVAEEALCKQIGMPVKKTCSMQLRCPSCNTHIGKSKFPCYCKNCGQKLEENDGFQGAD